MSPIAYRCISLAATAVLGSLLTLSACAPGTGDAGSTELTGAEEKSGADGDPISGSIPAGSTLTATTGVNLRTGPSTSDKILHVVPSGASVTLLDSNPQNGFYHVKHNGTSGWSFGKYYTGQSSGDGGDPNNDPSGGGNNPPNGGGQSGPRADAIARAKAGVGFSYWWGHGRFLPGGPSSANKGSCSGSCPSCSHKGSYGGDCSGFVAKVWQVPSNNADMTVDDHPYSTGDFVKDTSKWSTVSRSALQPADAMVYNSGGEGHVFLYSSGDGWGSIEAYECKGCAAGCVYDLRTASSAYHAIRRAGW
jgi:Bacterial SH3 domain